MAKKKAVKKKVTKKATKKKATKKKAVKKKVTKKATKKKATKKKAVKKKVTKKATKKKATKKKAVKKKVTKKATKKKATKKKAVKKKTIKKKVTKKTSAPKAAAKKKTAPKKKSAKKASVKAKAKKTVPIKKITMPLAPAVELVVYTPKVTVGEKVPDFTLPATGEKTVSLNALTGKKAVIFFYPRDATPGCTIEAKDFSNLKEEFESNNTVVYGVSRDSMKSHEKFKAKQEYTVDLICDENEELCSVFGAIKLKNMYGKKVRGIDRSTYIIDEEGKLIKEWRSVKVDGHADEVLSFVKASS